jgi:hypothetical protein
VQASQRPVRVVVLRLALQSLELVLPVVVLRLAPQSLEPVLPVAVQWLEPAQPRRPLPLTRPSPHRHPQQLLPGPGRQ